MEGIEQAHFETAHIQYNDENALSYTISLALFADTEIATKDSFREHLNKYNVIHLDVSTFWDYKI